MSSNKMSMADFESLLNEQLSNYRKGFNPGDRVQGVVTNIDQQYVTLDVNAKREGLVPLADMTRKDGSLRCAIGDSVEVIFAGMQHGAFMFSGSLDAKQVVDHTLADAYERQLPIEGRVEKEINGGYEVSIGGQRAFCPYSQISLFRQEGVEYQGKSFNFVITEYGNDERGQNVIVSRRVLLEKEREAQREELIEEFFEGMIVDGTVMRIMEFGVFVELGGVEGLIPLKEISWAREDKVEDLVKVGDKVEVQIKELDWERNRISLSLRGAKGDPWDEALKRFAVGSEFVGRITKLERFGAFAQLIPGVEGLIPISRLGGGRRLMSAREAVSEGQELLLKVESIEVERRRISLSVVDERIKDLQPGVLSIGMQIEGIVESIQNFGVFVRLSETQTGLLHVSETEVTKGGNPAAKLELAFPPASQVTVVVKGIEGDKISLTVPAKWESQVHQASDTRADEWRPEVVKDLGSLGAIFDTLDL